MLILQHHFIPLYFGREFVRADGWCSLARFFLIIAPQQPTNGLLGYGCVQTSLLWLWYNLPSGDAILNPSVSFQLFERVINTAHKAWFLLVIWNRNQYLIKRIPERTNIRSNSGTDSKTLRIARQYKTPSLAQPQHGCTNCGQIAQSRPPPAGARHSWKYHWVFRGHWGRQAATRQTRDWAVAIRLIAPPLPAESRPSKMTTMRSPVATTQSCNLINSFADESIPLK